LPYREYQRLLGAVHLGLCFHRSSSKVDLPMKIMDMFGAGLPVCVLDYGPCLAEQVQHHVSGLLFDSPADLKKQLCELFSSFPTDTRLLDELRLGVDRCRQQSWDENWQEHARAGLIG
jgi:beta-1,4-mannosyltransferase